MESAIQTSYVLKAAGISAVAISLLCPGFVPLTRAAGEDTAPPQEAENIDAEVTRAKNLFPLAEALDVAIIARVPFDEGTLTGTAKARG